MKTKKSKTHGRAHNPVRKAKRRMQWQIDTLFQRKELRGLREQVDLRSAIEGPNGVLIPQGEMQDA